MAVIDMSKVENQISRRIIGCAIEVHRTLGGPGLLESIYEQALVWELSDNGLKVAQQVNLPLRYKDREIGAPLRLDLVVNDKVIVECKATESYNKIFEAQTRTYLKLTGLKLGLVINFGEARLTKGIHRVVNNL